MAMSKEQLVQFAKGLVDATPDSPRLSAVNDVVNQVWSDADPETRKLQRAMKVEVREALRAAGLLDRESTEPLRENWDFPEDK